MPGFVDPHTHVVWAGDRARRNSNGAAGGRRGWPAPHAGGAGHLLRRLRRVRVAQPIRVPRPDADRGDAVRDAGRRDQRAGWPVGRARHRDGRARAPG